MPKILKDFLYLNLSPIKILIHLNHQLFFLLNLIIKGISLIYKIQTRHHHIHDISSGELANKHPSQFLNPLTKISLITLRCPPFLSLHIFPVVSLFPQLIESDWDTFQIANNSKYLKGNQIKDSLGQNELKPEC